MALLTPAYKLTFRRSTGGAGLGSGGTTVDTTSKPQASTVTELAVDLTMDGGADRCSLIMGQVGSFRPAIGDEIDVELGYADSDGSLEPVMTGTVVTTDPGLVHRRVVAHSAAHTLAHARLDKTFEDVNAG